MKKSDFEKMVKTLFLEYYPSGGGGKYLRAHIDEPPPVKEYDTLTPDSPENQENPEYYDPQHKYHPQPTHQGIGNFNSVDWQVVHQDLVTNTNISSELSDYPWGGDDKEHHLFSVRDFTDQDEGTLSPEQLELLDSSDIIGIDNDFPFIHDERYMNYDAFKSAVSQVWNKTTAPPHNTNNSPETPYLRGYEPMSEAMHEIYRQFKHIIKEEINEVDFATKIRGVFYEYAEGVPQATPTTQDPSRDASSGSTGNIARDPVGAAKAGENMEKTGQVIKNAANQVKSIQTLKEYVDSEILPTVIEIIKEAENPRATKRELLEFFKLTPK